MTGKLKIAMVVHGRFIAFDLASSLLRLGHDVHLFTNYPKWAVKRFGFPPERVRSFWPHGIATRAALKLHNANLISYRDEWFNPVFTRWASRELAKEHWDVVASWSGASEEILQSVGSKSIKLVFRGSAHIRTQARLLEEEENRTGLRQDKPSEWTIAREEREYAIADRVITLSTFARKSFLQEGVEANKVEVLPLGTSSEEFSPAQQVIEERCARVISGKPVRILSVGTQSFQKGFYDVAAVLRLLAGEVLAQRLAFRFVGPISPEIKTGLPEFASLAEFLPSRPQQELSETYAWGDVFWLPTIQDGYAVVLAQASASGLPILATTNSGGPDLVQEGKTGWILPIRSPQQFASRILWCDTHREELCEMSRAIYKQHKVRSWENVATDFEAICFRNSTDQESVKYAL